MVELASSDRILVIVGYPTDENGDDVEHREAARALTDLGLDGPYERVLAVGSAYARVDSADVPENVVIIPDDAAFVFTPNARTISADALPPFQPQQKLSVFADQVAPLRASETHTVTYACVEPRLAADIFALAALVCTETFLRREWAVGDARLLRLLARGEATIVRDAPDIFFGSADMPAQIAALPTRDREGLKALITEGLCTLRCYLRAGYHVRQNRAAVPGWAIQMRGKWLSLITSMFSIMPGECDKNLQESVLESSSMRKLLCDASLRVLSNYFHYVYIPSSRSADMATILTSALARDAGRGDEADLGNAMLYPDRPDHRNIVAWYSPHVWEALYAAFTQ